MAILNFQENRGVKMTFSGVIIGTLVRVGLCFVPQVPSGVADTIFWGIMGFFSSSVITRGVTDSITKGATSTVNSDTTIAKIQAKAEVDVAKIQKE